MTTCYDLPTATELVNKLSDLLHETDHGGDCPYRLPGCECLCGKGDAMVALDTLQRALERFLV